MKETCQDETRNVASKKESKKRLMVTGDTELARGAAAGWPSKRLFLAFLNMQLYFEAATEMHLAGFAAGGHHRRSGEGPLQQNSRDHTFTPGRVRLRNMGWVVSLSTVISQCSKCIQVGTRGLDLGAPLPAATPS